MLLIWSWLLLAQPAPVAGAAVDLPAVPQVQVQPRPDQRRVDVLVDGQPFTSYRWPDALSKPVLAPIRTPGGTPVTRGFPLEPGAGESRDHPHHAGLWFTYGDVVGVDFWANTGSWWRKLLFRFGSVVHRSIDQVRSGPGQGELTASADWIVPGDRSVLHEQTRYTFGAGAGRRSIDRVATLTATDGPVGLPDNKEGLLGLRLGRSLEHPSGDNPGGTGQYRSSEGKTGDQVWGTRARWVMLTGQLEQEPVTVAILDHPGNPGYPTYWHARGYGLFAANPLGARVFSDGKHRLGFTIQPGRPARFAYRVLVLSGHRTPQDIEAEFRRFAGELDPAAGVK